MNELWETLTRSLLKLGKKSFFLLRMLSRLVADGRRPAGEAAHGNIRQMFSLQPALAFDVYR